MGRVHGHDSGGLVGQVLLEHGLDCLRGRLGLLLVVEGVVDGGVEESSLPPERVDHFYKGENHQIDIIMGNTTHWTS